jgi:hypothetical protein
VYIYVYVCMYVYTYVCVFVCVINVNLFTVMAYEPGLESVGDVGTFNRRELRRGQLQERV